MSSPVLPEKIGKNNMNIFIVSVMPCTDKKFEVPVKNSAATGSAMSISR